MILIIIGTSSSGKSTLARQLQKRLLPKYFLFSVDDFLEKSMPPEINFENPEEFEIINHATISEALSPLLI